LEALKKNLGFFFRFPLINGSFFWSFSLTNVQFCESQEGFLFFSWTIFGIYDIFKEKKKGNGKIH